MRFVCCREVLHSANFRAGPMNSWLFLSATRKMALGGGFFPSLPPSRGGLDPAPSLPQNQLHVPFPPN